jgi:hypothetical protein
MVFHGITDGMVREKVDSRPLNFTNSILRRDNSAPLRVVRSSNPKTDFATLPGVLSIILSVYILENKKVYNNIRRAL